MEIIKETFGLMEDGHMAHLYTMKNDHGMEVSVSDYGAVLVRVIVPDRNGNPVDVVLGYDDVEGYIRNSGSVGCFVGRNANRIGGARVTIDGKVYELEKNDGENNLHSGSMRAGNMFYHAESKSADNLAAVSFTTRMITMEQGFPGNLDVTVTYTLDQENTLAIHYEAISDEDTIVNFTNHSYFNLSGHNSGSVLDQEVQIVSHYFTPTGPDMIPTGEIRRVANTPMDFRMPKTIGQDIDRPYDALRIGGGYDHNYILETEAGNPVPVAEMFSPKTGIRMTVSTDLPGLQFYTANTLKTKLPGKDLSIYLPHAGACFETQYFPNVVNEPRFAKYRNSYVKAGDVVTTETSFRFAAEQENADV